MEVYLASSYFLSTWKRVPVVPMDVQLFESHSRTCTSTKADERGFSLRRPWTSTLRRECGAAWFRAKNQYQSIISFQGQKNTVNFHLMKWAWKIGHLPVAWSAYGRLLARKISTTGSSYTLSLEKKLSILKALLYAIFLEGILSSASPLFLVHSKKILPLFYWCKFIYLLPYGWWTAHLTPVQTIFVRRSELVFVTKNANG